MNIQMNATKKTNSGIFYLSAVLSVYIIQAALGGINPAIASFAAAYPNISLTTIMLLATLPMLTSIPANLALGSILKVLKYKGTLLLGLIIFLVSGVAPYFFQENFTAILVWRAINGIGFGIIFPMGPTMVSAYIETSKRASVLGYGTGLVNIMGLVFQSVGGILAAGFVHNVWFINLILCITLLFAIFLPKPLQLEETSSATSEAHTEKASIPGSTWILMALLFLQTLFIYPQFLYTSSVVQAAGVGDAAVAGYIMTTFSIGGIIAGSIFGKLFQAMGSRTLVFGSALLAVDLALMATATSLPLFFVANVIGGIGYASFLITIFTGISINTAPTAVPTAMGINSAGMAIAGFSSSFVAVFIANLFGQAANLRFPFFVAMVFFALCAVVALMKPPKIG